MHYVRFLRAPALSRSGKRLLLDLVLTINTDLSDAYLEPAQPVEVFIYAEARAQVPGKPFIYVLAGPGQISWRAGLRVLKPTIDVPASVQAHLRAGEEVRICASTRSSMSASGVGRIMQSVAASPADRSEGQVMPAYYALTLGPSDTQATPVAIGLRRLALDADAAVEFEEELGESMARHIWDGGVLAMCRMADACLARPREEEQGACMARVRAVLGDSPHLAVLELGCGIGVLGVGLAAVYPRMRLPGPRSCSILMTDLADAEARARANMARLGPPPDGPVDLAFESLDWEDGRHDRLGQKARSRRWDLIMLADCTYNPDTLPALVGTLAALHASNGAHGGPTPSRLFLATKNRHESELAVLGLLASDGWQVLGHEVMALPVLGAAAQTVELYLFERS